MFVCLFVCDAQAFSFETVTCCVDDEESTVIEGAEDKCFELHGCDYGCYKGYMKYNGRCVRAVCNDWTELPENDSLFRCCFKDNRCPDGNGLLCTYLALQYCPAQSVCYEINSNNYAGGKIKDICTVTQKTEVLNGRSINIVTTNIQSGTYCQAGYYVSGTECKPCPLRGTSDANISVKLNASTTVDVHNKGIEGCYINQGTSYEDETGYFDVSGECKY